MANEVLIKVTVDGDPSKAFNDIDAASRKATGGINETAKAAGGLGGVMKTVAGVAGGFVVANVVQNAAGAVMDFVGKSVKASTDLGESVNAVNKIFGESANQVMAWGKENANSFGLSQRAFNQLAVPLGAIFKNTGFEMQKTTDFTIQLTERAADMASVFNVDVSEALEAIQSGLRGEANPLERFGVGLSAAKVEAHALAMTGKEVASSLTEQEKMMARVDLIMTQTADTAGDFKDTSDGLANSQRILAARNEELQAKIGDKLAPVMLKITELKLKLIDVVLKLAEKFGPLIENIINLVKTGQTIDEWRTEIDKLPPSLQGIAEAVQTVAKFIHDAWPTIQQVIEVVVAQVIARIEGMIQVIGAIVEIVGSTIALVSALFHGDWSRAWEEMKDIAGAIVDLLIGQLRMQFGLLPDLLAGLARDAGQAFIDALSDLPRLLLNIGEQIIQGLIDGISRKLGPLRSIVNTVKGIVNEVGDFFGIRSPSTVFDKYGRGIMDGLIQGLNAREDALKNEVEDIIRLVGAVTGREVFEDLSIGTGPSARSSYGIPQGPEAEAALAHAIAMGYNTSGITINMNGPVYANDVEGVAGDMGWATMSAMQSRGVRF